MPTLKEYYDDPFNVLDNLRPTLFGRVFNPFLKYRLNRKIALGLAIFLGLIPWILFGFDSCIGQPINVLYRLPEYFSGAVTWDVLWQEAWVNNYGKEMHYSAFLLYGVMYWFLSRHLEKNFGIVKSKNVAYSAAVTLLSVALFEFYWMSSYAHFQQQPWVITFKFPQLRIIIQNIMFLIVGGLGTFYMFLDSYILDNNNKTIGRKYYFRFDAIALILILASIFTALLWWNYPWYVEHITVELTDGTLWTNSRNFPQTLYTIDLDPTDSVNAGVWFFVENNPVHALNTIVKTLWSAAICYIGWIKRH